MQVVMQCYFLKIFLKVKKKLSSEIAGLLKKLNIEIELIFGDLFCKSLTITQIFDAAENFEPCDSDIACRFGGKCINDFKSLVIHEGGRL